MCGGRGSWGLGIRQEVPVSAFLTCGEVGGLGWVGGWVGGWNEVLW